MLVCDDFDDPIPSWLVASLLPALLCAVGAAAGHLPLVRSLPPRVMPRIDGDSHLEESPDAQVEV
jgi:hypothetical protein